VAFAKEFSGPPNEKHRAYAIVRDATQAKTYLKSFPNMMDTKPVVDGGAGDVNNDQSEAYRQLVGLAEKQRANAPFLSSQQLFARVFSDPANAELAARSLRRPTTSSTSGSELQR
jgi:hypothetical protein